MIKVAVFGARGRMGATVCDAVVAADDCELVGQIDQGDSREPAAAADVVVDFTHPDAVMENVAWCIDHGLNVVVGTTGFTEPHYDQLRTKLAEHPGVGVIVAANFSIGAVLMMSFAKTAAPFFDSVEIVELHHPRKADAPSGTSQTTARMIADARREANCPDMPDATTSQADGARGALVNGIPVHSVRLQGLVAHQEVLLGGTGETLTIRHDSFDRVSFMPGVLAAVRAVVHRPGLTLGMADLLGVQ